MKIIDKMISERNIPEILKFTNGKPVVTLADFEKRREQIKSLLQDHVYGRLPEKPEHMRVELKSCDNSFCAGKAPLSKLEFTVTVSGKEFTFPVYAAIPRDKKNIPAFIFINFRKDVPDKYLPSEEIADRGYAVFSFCYKDITSDDGDFSNGIAKLLSPARRTQNSPGKIAMWAWAAMRVMDYAESIDCIDLSSVAVIGHSRLGKTALLSGAFDERFKYIISNNSGCTGAAVTRGKRGEHILDITNNFDYWFAKKYAKYAVDESSLPMDQHFLLAASAPRNILIGSAEEDTWADPESEFLSAYLASEVYEKIYNINGLSNSGDMPRAKAILGDGNIYYHVRHGLHYLSREDWILYMDYIDKKRKINEK